MTRFWFVKAVDWNGNFKTDIDFDYDFGKKFTLDLTNPSYITVKVNSTDLEKDIPWKYLDLALLLRDTKPYCYVQSVTENGRIANSLRNYNDPTQGAGSATPVWPVQTLKTTTFDACR